jgi:hypothetical protein
MDHVQPSGLDILQFLVLNLTISKILPATPKTCCQVIAVCKSADLLLMVLDAGKPHYHREILTRELESVSSLSSVVTPYCHALLDWQLEYRASDLAAVTLRPVYWADHAGGQGAALHAGLGSALQLLARLCGGLKLNLLLGW